MGLDVPVDDAPAVGVLQALGDLHGKVQRLLPIEDALYLHILLQGYAVDELHHQVIGRIRGGNVIDLDDVGVAQHGHGLALRPEAAAELLIPREFVFQNFYGHLPVQPVVQRFIYHGHAAGADDLQDLVPVIQQLPNIMIHV